MPVGKPFAQPEAILKALQSAGNLLQGKRGLSPLERELLLSIHPATDITQVLLDPEIRNSLGQANFGPVPASRFGTELPGGELPLAAVLASLPFGGAFAGSVKRGKNITKLDPTAGLDETTRVRRRLDAAAGEREVVSPEGIKVKESPLVRAVNKRGRGLEIIGIDKFGNESFIGSRNFIYNRRNINKLARDFDAVVEEFTETMAKLRDGEGRLIFIQKQ